jgi:WD40 repeat protein
MKPIHLLLVALIFFSACAPVAQAATSPSQPQASSATLAPAQPTQTVAPTATPTPSFPLTRDHPLPALQSIRMGNAAKLIPVASLNSEDIAEVLLTEAGDKIIINTTLGYQVLDRETFQPESYQPLSGMVFGREISPDGRWMAQLLPGNPKMFDMSLVVTDLQTGKTVCKYETVFPSNTNELVLYPDGGISYQTSGNNNHLWRWDSTCRVTLDERIDWPVLAMSEDGQQAAIGQGNEIFIYSTSGGSRKRLAEVSNPRGVHFLPDGKSILVTSKAGNAIYDLASGEKTHHFPGSMGDYFASYKPSRDDEWILINAYKQKRALRLSDYTLFTLPGEMNGSTLENGYVVTNDYIWDIEKQGKVASLKNYGATLMSADGTRVATSAMSEPRSIDILDLSNGGKLLFTIPDYYNPIALPDGTGFIAIHQGKTAFFDYTSDQPLAVLDLHYVAGQSLENGDFLVWDNLGNIYQLDPVNHSLLHSTRLPFVLSEASPQNLAPTWAQGKNYRFEDFLASFMTPRWSQWMVSHNRQIGIRKVEKGVVQFFNMRENSQAWQQVAAEDVIKTLTPGDVYEMTFSPDDRLAAGVFEKKLVIWEAATGKELRAIALPVPPGAVHDFEFSPDGSKLLLSHEKSTRDFSNSIHTDAALRVYDVQTGRLLKLLELKQVYRKSGCNISLPFAITSDSAQMVSITETCRLGLYDLASGKLTQEFGEPFENANIDLALSPDNRLLAVAYQNKLDLWDLAAGKLINSYANPALRIYPPHRDAEWSYIYQVVFSPDGTLLGTRFGRHYQYNSIITLWGVP